jgi:replicative DNA helicase
VLECRVSAASSTRSREGRGAEILEALPAPPGDDQAVRAWFDTDGWKLTPAALRAGLTQRHVAPELAIELLDEQADRQRAALEKRDTTRDREADPPSSPPPAVTGVTSDPVVPRSSSAAIVPLRKGAGLSSDPRGQLSRAGEPSGDRDVPPQNLEAEESVLGAMMMSPAAIDAVSELVTPQDFYRESHGIIFRAALALHAASEPVDAITLTDALEQSGDLGAVGGRVRLHALAGLVPASANVGHYARIVRETATLRGLIRAGGEISRLGWERPGEAVELVDRAQQITQGLGDTAATGATLPIGDALKESFARLTDRYESGKEIVGLPSGFRDLDRLTAGFEPGNLIIVAARPSMGKSALVHAFAANAAIRDGATVALFTPEMSRNEITQRLLAREAHVDLYRLRTGKLNPDDWPRLTAAGNTLSKAPIHVNDQGNLGLATVRAECRRLMKQGLALVIVDYLQLMAADGENRNLEVAALSRGLKVLARDLEVPVIALSQLSRAVEGRNDKRPVLSDLRDSGAVEQDADLVMFLYRDDYYNPETSEEKGICEVIIAKHRNGATDKCRLAFQAGCATFTDLHIPGVMG